MTSRLVALCVDANDPARLARFWAEALRWDVDARSSEEVGLVPTDGTGFRLVFLPVVGTKTGQNRIHLDLTTTSLDDQRATVAALLERGGRPIDIGQRPEERHVVLADPEGNELCVIEPGNTFLSNTGRLGGGTGSASTSLRSATATRAPRSPVSSRSGRHESTSARAGPVGWSWPTPTTTSSVSWIR